MSFELSIFEEVTKGGAAKASVAKRRTVKAEELGDVIKSFAWSPNLFKDNRRRNENFEACGLLAVDIDDNLTVEEAVNRLQEKGLSYVITFTKSHRKEKNGISCDRFRVILFPNEVIVCEVNYAATISKLFELFPEADASCRDQARFYFASSGKTENNDLKLVSLTGDEFKISKDVKKTELTPTRSVTTVENYYEDKNSLKQAVRFLSDGSSGLPGEFNNHIFAFALTAARNGFYKEDVIQKAEMIAPDILDCSDLASINSGFFRGRENVSLVRRKERASFLMSWIGLEVLADGSLKIRGRECTPQHALNYIGVLDKEKGGARIRCGDKYIMQLLQTFIDDKKSILVKEMSHRLAFNGEGSDRSTDFIKAICGNEDEVSIGVFNHWIANVKRKLSGQRARDHIMIVFTGKQGSGKSEALNRLCEPLEDVCIPTDFKELTDNRSRRMLCDNFIVKLDEMSLISWADVNVLKAMITDKRVSYRPMGTNENVKALNNASLIGASNNDLGDILKDQTGARRFLGIESADKCDWDAINNIDYLALWKSVDTEVDHLKEIKGKLTERQRGYRQKDSVEYWILECGLVPRSDVEKTFFATKNAYEKYRQFCVNSSLKPFPKPYFGKRLKKHLDSGKVKGARGFYFRYDGDGRSKINFGFCNRCDDEE